MHSRAKKIFWMSFIGFCAYVFMLFRFFRPPVPRESSNADAVISTIVLLLCGAVIRYWFHKNQDKFRG